MASSFSMIGLLLLVTQASPAPARAVAKKPAPTLQATFSTVLGGKLPAGRNVDFPAVLLPLTAVQTTSAGKTRYFVLAVAKDSDYMRSLAADAQALREQGLAKARELAGVVGDDARYRTLMAELDALIEKATGDKKRSRTEMVLPGETIAVEVSGMEALSGVYKWETLGETSPLAVQPASGPILTLPKPAFEEVFLEASVRSELLNLSLGRPPNLDKKLPELPQNPKLTEWRVLESFNAAVAMHNAELQRRRQYAVARTEEDVRLLLERLDRVLAFEELTLSATVTAPVEIAATTFTKIHGASPTAFVRERAKPEAAFVRRYFATTRLQICAYPSGANVNVDGRDLGAAPVLVRDLPVDARVKIVVSHPGYEPRAETQRIFAQPSGVTRLDLPLDLEGGTQTRGLTIEEGAKLFSAAFTPAKPFALHLSAPSELPGFKGKKDKDGVKRVQEIRKLIAGAGPYAAWFRLVPTPDEAEVVLELVLPEAAAGAAKKDRELRTLIRNGTLEDTATLTLSLDADKAVAGHILDHLTEHLKSASWQRALGIAATP